VDVDLADGAEVGGDRGFGDVGRGRVEDGGVFAADQQQELVVLVLRVRVGDRRDPEAAAGLEPEPGWRRKSLGVSRANSTQQGRDTDEQAADDQGRVPPYRPPAVAPPTAHRSKLLDVVPSAAAEGPAARI
jgi:hypothetical protein